MFHIDALTKYPISDKIAHSLSEPNLQTPFPTDSKTKPTAALPPTLDRDRILNVHQVAALLNFSVAHTRRLHYQGKIPRPIKIGGLKNGWRVGVIADFLAAASAQAEAAATAGIGGRA